MQDIMGMLSSLRRPKLLVEAARVGASEYRRERHLGRILGMTPLRSGPAVFSLFEIETELNDCRVSGEGGYSASRHVEVLAALIGEANLLEAVQVDAAS